MCQTSYIDDVLDHFGMKNSKAVATATDPSKKLMKPEQASQKSMAH